MNSCAVPDRSRRNPRRTVFDFKTERRALAEGANYDEATPRRRRIGPHADHTVLELIMQRIN
jgi:hypothetical protein